MSRLQTLKDTKDLFLENIPPKPQGRYVHFVLLRETESFPVFQTDGTLNVITVQAGLADPTRISRLVMFKRKQTSPERLTGRELLRSSGFIADSEKDVSGKTNNHWCEYNSQNFCKRCPDCIHYGYAIGDKGAEKSKVYADSAFSITAYEDSHKSFTFNALYEHGTMTEAGKTRASFGEQDHIVPQVFFPAIVTLKDATYEGFLYVLGNILRTDRYGAQETRTGRLFNHVIAILFTNGEIFSNLRFTQAIYDHMKNRGNLNPPLDRQSVLRATREVYQELRQVEPVRVVEELVTKEPKDPHENLTGAESNNPNPLHLGGLISEVVSLYQDQEKTQELLQSLYGKTEKYAKEHGALKVKKATKGKKAKGETEEVEEETAEEGGEEES